MYRNREARRATIVGSNDFKRRRHRTNSLRESPEDVEVELQEPGNLRDRLKKDRDRERERDRDRDREGERDLRERSSSRSKRRRAERFASNREDVGKEETSDESVDDNEDYEDEEGSVSISASGGGVRVLPPAVGSMHGNIVNHNLNHNGSLAQSQQNFSSNNIVGCNQLQHRKTFPTTSSSKLFKTASVRKPGDEMIGVSVPRKARSACAKRSHDWISSSSNNNNSSVSGVIGEQILVQASSSPASQSPVSTTASLLAGPVSPSSNASSIRKKLKLNSGGNNGPKVKPPKVASNTSSSNPEELEIEIAEVLYGLKTHSQDPSLKKEDSREATRSSSDAKFLISSAISNPASTSNPVSALNSSRLTVVAPKRKRPRQAVENSSYGVRSSPILDKPEMEHAPAVESTSPKTEKTGGSATENGYEMGGDSASLQAPPAHFLDLKAREFVKTDSGFTSKVEEVRDDIDLVKEADVCSHKAKESSLAKSDPCSHVDSTATPLAAVSIIKESSAVPELENQNEKKFIIDLMMDPPPQVKSSPEREAKIDFRAQAAYEKQSLTAPDAELKTAALMDREYETEKVGKAQPANISAEDEKPRRTLEEDESVRSVEKKVRNTNNLLLDPDELSRDGSAGADAVDNKLPQQARKQQPQMHKMPKEESFLGKSGQPSNSLPVSMPNLPPGYMASLQGVVPIGGGGATSAPAPIQAQFNQPRPKRCETHCYIARNISYIQQFMKMNPFWQAAGTASFLGSKPSNPSTAAPNDLHGGNTFKAAQNLAHGGSEKSSQSANASDSVQRKQQILLQQALPPVAPNNLLGPAFIFPLNHQQQAAVAAASTRPAAPKSQATAGQPSSIAASSSAMSGSNPAGAVSFNYPNMGSNETQYLAILQNNAYPFPIPAVGAPPNYRGSPAQAMPLFTGPFYSSQMIHPPFPQPTQLQQAHKNSSSSSGSSSSQKHLQNQQIRSQSSGVNVAAEKSVSSSHHLQQSLRPRQLENESGEGSPDIRGSCPPMNMYGQNFAMPIHPQNFSLMAPPAGAGNHGERLQQQGSKAGVGSLPAQSFGPTGSGIDLSAAQNYAIFQSFPDSARQSIQMMAAAAATAQVSQKKSLRISEDVIKSRGEDPSLDDEGKSLSGKAVGMTRSNLVDSSTPSVQPNTVIDGLPQSMNAAVAVSGPIRSSPPVNAASMTAINVQNAHIQAQLHQQQILQIKQQQLVATASNQSKAPATGSNGNIYSDQAKFPNSVSGFPQNMVHGSNIGASKSPQWNNSSRAPAPQAQSHVASSAMSTFKSLPHQHSRAQPRMHGQISFGGNQKPSPGSPGHVSPSGNLAPSPVLVGSPSNSSVSKGSSGSPRTTPAANNKIAQASSLSAHQQPKPLSSSHPVQKSQSILGHPHVASSSSAAKPHVQKQSHPHQQLPKNVQQTQLFFSNPYSQVQSSQPVAGVSPASTSAPTGYYTQQRRRPEQHHQPGQQVPGVASSSSPSGVLQLCPPTVLSKSSTNDPAMAIATATANATSSHGVVHPAQAGAESSGTLLPAGFSYVQPVPAVVQAKPSEQKQTAG